MEELAGAVFYGTRLDDDTAVWLGEIDAALVENLEAAGLEACPNALWRLLFALSPLPF